MKLTELYQYIKSGRFSTDIMFNFKKNPQYRNITPGRRFRTKDFNAIVF